MTPTTTSTVTSNTAAPAPAERPPLTIPRQLGPVTLLHEIGRGGMGTVWLGRHELLQRDVAVKFLLNQVADSADPGFAEFLAGARAASAVRHLGLTAILNADLIEGCPYLVMEFVEGASLAQILRASGGMAPASAVAVMRRIADAIAELHDHNIIHRDIKPANVLVDLDGRTYVTDFGLACTRTHQGNRVAGTPAYMAPEMHDGQISPRSDVFAMGVMLHEMITARLPVEGTLDQVREFYGKHKGPLQQLRDKKVAEPLIELIERAMHKDPIFRFKSARHFARALEQLPYASPDPASVLAPMVARTRAAVSDAGAEVAPSSQADYYSGLSDLADKKREKQSSGATAQLPEVPPTTPSPPARPADFFGRLRESWSCIGCGYDLRWQLRDGRCPECARPVVETVDPKLLKFADPHWVHTIARGLRLCSLGLNGWVLGMLAAGAILVWFFNTKRSIVWGGIPAAGSLGVLIVALAQVFLVRGARLLTTRAPDDAHAGGFPTPRHVRLASWLMLPAFLVGLLPVQNKRAVVAYAFDVFSGAGALVGIACLWVLLRYLMRLAHRAQQRKWLRKIRHSSYAACIVAVGVPIYLIARPFFPGERDALPQIVAGILQLYMVFAPSSAAYFAERLRKLFLKATKEHVEYATLFVTESTAEMTTPRVAPPDA